MSSRSPDPIPSAETESRIGDKEPLVWPRNDFDRTMKLVVGHNLFIADLLASHDPDLVPALGMTRPFAAQDIQVHIAEWQKWTGLREDKLSQNYSDIVAVLHNERGAPCCLVALELQATRDPAMSWRLLNYEALVCRFALEHKWRDPTTGQPLPIWVGVVYIGPEPWDPPPMVNNAHPAGPSPYLRTCDHAVALLDTRPWRDWTLDQLGTAELTDLKEAFFRFEVLRSRLLRLRSASPQALPALSAKVQALMRALAALGRLAAAEIRTRDETGTFDTRLALWISVGILPTCRVILQQEELANITSLEELVMLEGAATDYAVALAEATATTHDQGRDQGRVEERIAALLDMAVMTGAAMDNAARTECQSRLRRLPLARIPTAATFAAYLQQFAAGPVRQTAALAFLAAGGPPPDA